MPPRLKPLELTAQRPGDGLSERSFSHPRRPDETENRRLGRRIEFHDTEVFKNAFFDVLQIVVVLVEDLPGACRYRGHPAFAPSTATRGRIRDKRA